MKCHDSNIIITLFASYISLDSTSHVLSNFIPLMTITNIIKIKLFIRLWSNELSPQFSKQLQYLRHSNPRSASWFGSANMMQHWQAQDVTNCKRHTNIQVASIPMVPLVAQFCCFRIARSYDTQTFLITNLCNTLVCLLTLWLKSLTNGNKTKIRTSMCFVTSTCEQEHVTPFIDHVLPSFKAKWLSSTEAPSTSYIINAILVITFVCLVMPCHVIEQTHTLERKTRIMKHPDENLWKGVTNVTSLPNNFTLTMIFVNSHTMRCWDR